MKKLLILAYDFPPYVSVGGLRPYNWYRYLKEFDIEPIVITRQWNNQFGSHLDYISPGNSDDVIFEQTEFGTILRTPYKPNLSNRILLKYGDSKFRWLRKFISGYYELMQFVLPIGPRKEILRAARDFLSKNEVDVIIATGDPFILFGYASKLSKEYNTPWIADYRDTWVQDKTRSGNAFNKLWNSYFERKILENVTVITTVSTFLVKQLQQNIKNKPFEIVLNGYDPENIRVSESINQQNENFVISFAGTIYKWHPIESFLNVCNTLCSEHKLSNFKLKFYGSNINTEIENLIRNKYHFLSGKVTTYPKIDNALLIKELAEANSFLLFNDYSILGTKIFTYLGIKRNIILCYSADKEAFKLKEKYYNLKEFNSESKHLQADLIRETNSGIIVKDSAHLKVVLNELWEEFQSTGKIACNSVGVENYSRKIQVEKLAQIVKSL